MSVNDKTENRGTHGVSSSMLDTLVSSSENPLSLDMGSVKKTCDKIRAGGENTIPNTNRPQSPIFKYGVEGGTD